MSTPSTISVLGAGRWGTAIASVLADNGHNVLLWCLEPEVALDINRDHINRMYCPNDSLSKNITAVTSLEEAVKEATWIFEAVPVKHLRNIVEQAQPHLTHNATWVVLSKGIETETLMLPTQIIADVLGNTIETGVVSGPTFAAELLKKQFSAADIAGSNEQVATELAGLLKNEYFSPHISSDQVGVQVGGATKNVLALMTGLVNGAGYKDNTTAYLLTQALKEITQLIIAMGGEKTTLYGLSGLGDIILSCTGSLSKNLKAGRLLAQGKTMEELTSEFGTLPEGINTVQSIQELAQRYDVSLPICQKTYEIIFNNTSIKTLLQVI